MAGLVRALTIAAMVALAGCRADQAPANGTEASIAPTRPTTSTDRPALALLTSLPLMFPERFGLSNGPPPGAAAMARLNAAYRVEAIAAAEPEALAGRSLLLMAHARAQPSELLVGLDQWIRDGGHLLLLADPRLDFESAKPLGDLSRPSPGFPDTGLIGHWGLSLSARDDGTGVFATADRACVVRDSGQLAECRLGKGRVIVIGDADFLLDGPSPALDRMMAELANLATN